MEVVLPNKPYSEINWELLHTRISAFEKIGVLQDYLR